MTIKDNVIEDKYGEDKMNRMNLILATDSYKVTHWKQYPPNTQHVYSYLESRGGEFEKTIFFGLQYFLKKYFEGVVVTNEDINEAGKIFGKHFDQYLFNYAGWQRIVDIHDGKLPVSICAVPEGSINNVHTPLMTIENTDPELPWLTNYLETMLVEIWYPITVATQSYFMKKTLLKYLNATGTPDDVLFKLHDFGFRGVSSPETAAIGGAAHLVNFLGTDNIVAIMMLKEYYHCDCAGFSIPASEHSTITSWGKENEVYAFENMLQQFPDGIVACVSDSYNIFEACENLWGEKLKSQIMNRNGTLVVRPDSGEPTKIVLTCLEILGDKFGYSINSKGYKVLDPHIRLIQGDGIDYVTMTLILRATREVGWSTDNIAFGSGGALLQKLNRDTNKFAFKCSNITKGGIDYPVFKDPITAKDKTSKSGRFEGLTEVFRDGIILKEYSLDEIRSRVNQSNI